MSIRQAFEEGRFRDLLAREHEVSSIEDQVHLIGALCFLGKRSDAEIFFEERRHEFQAVQLAACRFFLAVALTRESQYESARKHLLENLREARRSKDEKLRFFAYQGPGFYRYFNSRFTQSLQWSRRAWKSSRLARFRFGTLLSSDLAGHCFVQNGKTAEGLRYLNEALEVAQSLGNRSFQGALKVSIAGYEAQFGWDSAQSIKKLKALLKDPEIQDSYSKSNVMFELARQYALRGELRSAERVLAQADKHVLATGLSRQKALLALRRAYVSLLRGDQSHAVSMIQLARGSIHPEIDLHILIQCEGLAVRCGLMPEIDLAGMTSRIGSGIGKRILAREGAITHREKTTDDRVGALLDQLSRNPFPSPTQVEEILGSGYLSLLTATLPLGHGSRHLLLDLRPGGLFIFDRGEIQISSGELSSQLRALILRLSKGACSKRRLVESLWGYEYHSLRHDPMLYALISRLRKLLGSCEGWLINQEDGYAFEGSVTVSVHDPRSSQLAAPKVERQGDLSTPLLNSRQLLALDYLRENRFIGVQDYAKHFQVSTPSATRDLTLLVQQGWARKVGRARATRYCWGKEVGEGA